MDLGSLATLGGGESAAASALLGGSIELPASVVHHLHEGAGAHELLEGATAPTGRASRALLAEQSRYGSATADPSAFLDYLRGAWVARSRTRATSRWAVSTRRIWPPRSRRATRSATCPTSTRARSRGALDSLGGGAPPTAGFLDTPLPVRPSTSTPTGWVRRFEMALKCRSRAGPFDGTMQVDFFDFGTNVDVEAPPADQVTDLKGALFSKLAPSKRLVVERLLLELITIQVTGRPVCPVCTRQSRWCGGWRCRDLVWRRRRFAIASARDRARVSPSPLLLSVLLCRGQQ